MRISDWSSDVCSSDLLLRQRQMRALVSARRGIEKNPAHAHFHPMDGGVGDELPSFNQQGFDVLVDGDAQTLWFDEQLALVDGGTQRGVLDTLHERPGVDKARAQSGESASNPTPARQDAADTLSNHPVD